jgi:hypothetical protein
MATKISEAYRMTNLLEQAINANDGNRAVKIMQDAPRGLYPTLHSLGCV